jgi:fimbrial chaperone protein
MPCTKLRLIIPLFAVALSGLAFTLKPMSVTFDPKGSGASRMLRVENESSNRVAFQISVVSRDMDLEGQEKQEPATNLFTVFPPQGVIAPGQDQSIRMVWRGTPTPTDELCYRVVAEELPVNFVPEKGKAQIKILLRYQGTVYVRPKSAKPDLRVLELAKTETNLWSLVITNAGTAHQNLINPTLVITNGPGQKTEIAAGQLSLLEGENVLPHRSRRFLIALPAEFTESRYPALIKVDE